MMAMPVAEPRAAAPPAPSTAPAPAATKGAASPPVTPGKGTQSRKRAKIHAAKWGRCVEILQNSLCNCEC